MTECDKVFLDTAPLIYFLDEDINFGVKTQSIFEAVLSAGKKIASSVITCQQSNGRTSTSSSDLYRM